jgi:hypothetical protein
MNMSNWRETRRYAEGSAELGRPKGARGLSADEGY